MKTTIKSIYRPYKNGMYKDVYKVNYENGRCFWYDLNKIGSMPEKHFEFMMNARCIPIYANKYNGNHEGEHIADKFI